MQVRRDSTATPRADSPPPIQTRGLAKSYGLLPVLRGIDLDVQSGECIALLGANGAGKSSLLKLLAGVSRASRGTLKLFGNDCHPQRPGAEVLARIGFVGHEPLVYRDLTPRENLAFFGRLYGIANSTDEIGDRVDRTIEAVGLGIYAERAVRTLSRGTLQRVALARATLHQPELLLLDEPFTGLDDTGRGQLRDQLKDLHASGVTSVLVSHDMSEVSQVASRAAILVRGKIAEDLDTIPPPEELGRRYRALVGAGISHVDDRS